MGILGVMIRKFLSVAIASLLGGSVGSASWRIEANEDSIEVETTERLPLMRVLAYPAEGGGSEPIVAWEGEGDGVIRFARKQQGFDLLFRRFELVDGEKGTPVEGGARWVTGFSSVDRSPPFDLAIGRNGKKGLAANHGLVDPVALGVRHLARNLTLKSFVTPDRADGPFFQEIDGVRVGLREGTVRALDRDLLAAAERGMTVTLVFYNAFDRGAPAGWPLIHPKTDRQGAPAAVGAFNTVTPEGTRCLRAALEFLSRRYLGPDGSHGRFHGLVMGNEVQSHWMWNNQGDADPDEVVRDYAVAVRLADLATRERHAGLPVYVSMDHYWAATHLPDAPGRTMPGRVFLEKFQAQAAKEGDFPWALALHPYPENLFEPDFWNDRDCTFSLTTPKISFKNLEVIVAAVERPGWAFETQPRRIALTEQGFNFLPRWPDAGQKQAAAYAMAWKKINAIPRIEVMHYHRHVDNPHEGGLKLGLRSEAPGSQTGLGEKRPIWDVFQAAGTPDEDAAFRFALPLIGAPDWATAAKSSPVAE